MAFINELMPAEDMAKYSNESINHRWNISSSGADWTADRGRGIYLREVGQNIEEMGRHRYYTLYWKGVLIAITLYKQGHDVIGGEGWVEYGLMKIDIPAALEAKRSEILADLKDALSVFGNRGVYALAVTTKVTFNF
jgi:hypothetical protein